MTSISPTQADNEELKAILSDNDNLLSSKKRAPKRVYDDEDDTDDEITALWSTTKRPKLQEPPRDSVMISPVAALGKKAIDNITRDSNDEDDESYRTESSNGVYDENIGSEEEDEDDSEHQVVVGTVDDLIRGAREQARSEFEQTKKRVLDGLPPFYKQLFGEMGFAVGRLRSGNMSRLDPSIINRQQQHGQDSVCWPARVLSPYQIPPGELRKFWMSMFEQAKTEQTVPPLLVYLYGMGDGPGSYRVMPLQNFCPYSHSTTAMRESALDFTGIAAESSFSELDFRRVRAQGAFLADLKLDRCERRHGLTIFRETHEILSIQDLHMA